MSLLTKLWNDLAGALSPDVCSVCGTPLVDGERILCLGCLSRMPLTGIHTAGHTELHERVISTRTPVEKMAAMMWYYRDNEYSSLIHDAKYRSRPSIASTLAEYYASDLNRHGFFDDIDVIIPVPMHITKILLRGYNQAQVIAQALSKSTGIPVTDNLVCRHSHSTQTRKDAAERYANAIDTYAVESPPELDSRHILLVDDVLTTGATLSACATVLHTASPTARISILTLAATRLR